VPGEEMLVGRQGSVDRGGSGADGDAVGALRTRRRAPALQSHPHEHATSVHSSESSAPDRAAEAARAHAAE
jgi:hypothetical protein